MAAPDNAPKRSIATVCLSGTLEDKLDAAAAAGFDGIEVFENDLVSSPWSPAEVRRRCADLGLSIDLYQPFRDFEAVPPEVLEANLRRAERKFDLMETLGTDTMLVCSSVSPDAVDDDDLAAEHLHELAARAGERGLRIAYEALAWGRFVDTYEHSWRIVRRADHPALGLCLDSFHVLSRGSELATIRTIPADKLFFLQLADAPRLHMDVLQWSRHHRLFPGQGALDLTTFTANVMSTGYGGPLSLEVFNDVFRQADPHRAAVDAMRSLVWLQEATATSHQASAGGTRPHATPAAATVHERVAPAGLPAAPRLSGHAFTELAARDASTAALATTLAALGFVHTGNHRSKPVQLWQQGTARILLNDGAGDGELGALAVESADPIGSARRAEKLLAPTLPRDHRADEADLQSVATPDGTAVFFCRTGADDADSWLADFAPTGRPAPAGPLTGVDHISLTQPFDNFDEAALFYRTVLGLTPEPATEFAAPFGMVRSRAMASADGGVRLALNVALLRRGEWSPAVPEPQHIAFAADDALIAAKAARSAGAPILDIPGNYYDDLDARLDLPPDLLAQLREHSVLYDRDSRGEFLHFCTPILGTRVFFEVVQRIGDYGGYGATNAPVRMAAHRRLRHRTH